MKHINYVGRVHFILKNIRLKVQSILLRYFSINAAFIKLQWLHFIVTR